MAAAKKKSATKSKKKAAPKKPAKQLARAKAKAARRPPEKKKPPAPVKKPTKLAAKQPAKPAAKKPSAKKSAGKPQVLTMRGSGLVELAIAADRERRDPAHPPRPMRRAQIDLLEMPSGDEIPQSLAAWLAYDALDIFAGNPEAPHLNWQSFGEMMQEEFDDEIAAQFADFGKLLTGKCLVLPGGSDSRRFMYAGNPDAHGEYPVFIVDTDELPWVGLAYPGFDAYIADGLVANVITDTYMDAWQHDHWAPHLEHHARANFGGFKALDYQDPEHVDGAPAARSAMEQILGRTSDLSPEDFDEFG
jgi:hypothetical protein